MNRVQTQTQTRIKICGITREEDVLAAVEAGADAIGLVCFEGSKRYVTPARAAQLRKQAPPFVSVVTLFVNAHPDSVRAVIDQVRPDLLQFHGDELPDDCQQYRHPYLRALRVGAPGLDTADGLAQTCMQYQSADGWCADWCAGWLFDTYTPAYGGSGQTFDHTLLARVFAVATTTRPVILAGGLTAANVAATVRAVRPWAVDVSSGVETAPGIKSAEKIRAFVAAVRGQPVVKNSDLTVGASPPPIRGAFGSK